MQPTLHLPSNSDSQLFYPWKPYKSHLFASQITRLSIRTETSFKPLAVSISLGTSRGHEFERECEDISTEKIAAAPTRLPIVVHRYGTVCRYVWEEEEFKLVSADEDVFLLSSFFRDLEGGFRRLYRVFCLTVRSFFLPRYVSENYLEYVKWKLLHRVCSSTLQVLATQAMLRAIGIGHSRSLPSAAALNWVLKDGLGRLCRCLYTATLASAFDTNLKRVRFVTSVLFSLSIGVELLTPIFPHHFLLLASLANIAKQISLACYLATGSAVHRSFAIADNLGEVSAKSQIQTVCFDNLGLMLAAALDILLQKNQRLQGTLPFLIYPIFTTFDLYGIYKGLKHVHLQTLTKDRLEIIINTWIKLRYVPSPAEVSNKEGIGFPLKKGSDSLWPIRIGWLNPKDKVSNLTSATMMQSMKESDFYFICLEVSRRFLRTKQKQIVLCMREGACSSDIIMGILQACYIRNAILSGMKEWEFNLEYCDSHMSDFAIREWSKLIERTKGVTIQELTLLTENMVMLGWTTKHILLSTEEQSRYGFADD